METHLHLSRDTWARLEQHLFQDDFEQAAILYARTEESDTTLLLREHELFLLQSSDYSYQSAFHIEMADDTQAKVIRRAWELSCSIVEIHSHVGREAEPEFSSSDIVGFREFVPHVWWRLRGKPYMAMVFTPTGFDSLVWRRNAVQAEPLRKVVAEGSESYPSNLTLNRRRRANVRSI